VRLKEPVVKVWRRMKVLRERSRVLSLVTTASPLPTTQRGTSDGQCGFTECFAQCAEIGRTLMASLTEKARHLSAVLLHP
jgi:hypothetical protein